MAGIQASRFKDYQDYSIGFLTRGCFRGCPFCVNQTSCGVKFHAHVQEFFDPSRKYIYLWDDNVLGYPKWRDVFEELADTGRRFQFRQGMDIRIMTEEKAEVLSKARYIGEYIFAFDHPEEREQIEKGIRKNGNRLKKAFGAGRSTTRKSPSFTFSAVMTARMLQILPIRLCGSAF